MIRRLFIIAVLLISAMHPALSQTGTWSGKLDLQGTRLSIVFHLDEENPVMDSPDQGAYGIPIQFERSGTGVLTVRIPSLGATFEGVFFLKQIVGTFKQMGLSLPLTLTPGDDRPARPQTPQGPFPYSEEEISFTNGDIALNGTLVLPEDCTRETPVVLMITGSGQQNRDEEIFEHKPFAVIADALARAGIASLRYDDRGFGDKSLNPLQWTTEDYMDDAMSGIGFLRERFDKVGVIGHSEGGTIAMMLAADNQVDFIVSLAGMVISGAETLIWQNRMSLSEAGFPHAVTDTYCKLLETAFEAALNGGTMPDTDFYELPDALKQNYQAVLAQIRFPYMRYFLTLDVRPMLGKISCPVLALNGTKDIQVEHTANLNALRTALPSGNVIEEIDGVNHLFQHCMSGAVTEYRTIEETIAPEVLEKMTVWINQIK